MMKKIEWDDGYEVGDSVIDGQHRQIVDLANLVLCALEEGCEQCASDSSLFKETFEALNRYTQKHFADEERFMKEHNIPGLERMQEHHAVLIREMHDLWAPGKEALMSRTAEGLLGWMRGRLVPHFTKVDQVFFADYAFLDDDEIIEKNKKAG